MKYIDEPLTFEEYKAKHQEGFDKICALIDQNNEVNPGGCGIVKDTIEEWYKSYLEDFEKGKEFRQEQYRIMEEKERESEKRNRPLTFEEFKLEKDAFLKDYNKKAKNHNKENPECKFELYSMERLYDEYLSFYHWMNSKNSISQENKKKKPEEIEALDIEEFYAITEVKDGFERYNANIREHNKVHPENPIPEETRVGFYQGYLRWYYGDKPVKNDGDGFGSEGFEK